MPKKKASRLRRRRNPSSARDIAALKIAVERCEAQIDRLTNGHELTLKRIGTLQAELDSLRLGR